MSATRAPTRIDATREPQPHSIEAEQALLGGLMIDADAWVRIAEVIREDDIYRPDHRLIFAGIEALVRAGKPRDQVTLADELERQGVLEAAGGLPYLSSLARDTPTAANVRAYADIVRERAKLRRLIKFGGSIPSRIADGATAADLIAAFDAEAPKVTPNPDSRAVLRIAPISWDTLEGSDPPPRVWVIPHWVPDAHMTLLAGRAGVGKTLIGQHVASALALGFEYLEPLDPRRVLMWAGEDDEAELWRRQVNICSWMQRPLSALTQRLFLHSYAGADITLLAPVFGALAATPMLTELREQVADYRAQVVILDNIARLYGGSENDRHAVTTFCALVQGACSPAAVILLGHPAKAAGSEYSGSTAWEGAVRARLYLSDRPPDQDPADDGAPVDDTIRYLSRRKANYSARDIRRFSLIDGVLIPSAVEQAVDKPAGMFLEDIVLRALQKLSAQGIHGTASTASPNYLPRLAERYGLLDTASKKTFAKGMCALVMGGKLVSREIGRNANRTPKMGLVIP